MQTDIFDTIECFNREQIPGRDCACTGLRKSEGALFHMTLPTLFQKTTIWVVSSTSTVMRNRISVSGVEKCVSVLQVTSSTHPRKHVFLVSIFVMEMISKYKN